MWLLRGLIILKIKIEMVISALLMLVISSQVSGSSQVGFGRAE